MCTQQWGSAPEMKVQQPELLEQRAAAQGLDKTLCCRSITQFGMSTTSVSQICNLCMSCIGEAHGSRCLGLSDNFTCMATGGKHTCSWQPAKSGLSSQLLHHLRPQVTPPRASTI